MSAPRHSESAFETVIETHLPANGYVSVAGGGFDRDRAFFPVTVLHSIREPRSKNRANTKRLHGDKNSHRLPFNQAPGANAKAQFTH